MCETYNEYEEEDVVTESKWVAEKREKHAFNLLIEIV